MVWKTHPLTGSICTPTGTELFFSILNVLPRVLSSTKAVASEAAILPSMRMELLSVVPTRPRLVRPMLMSTFAWTQKRCSVRPDDSHSYARQLLFSCH